MQADRRYVHVGTYSHAGGGRGAGIHTFEAGAGGRLTPVRVTATRDPSFLTLGPTGERLYAVNEVDGGEGGVSAFAVERGTGELTPLGEKPSLGTAPCHLSVHPSGRWLLLANYGSGSLVVYELRPDGGLGDVADVVQHAGSGPHPNQGGPHAHMVVTDPAGGFVLAADLGADRVFAYRLDPASGKLLRTGETPLPPGSGPRHIAFHPEHDAVYVLNELLSTVAVFGYDAGRGELEHLGIVRALPDGWTGDSSGAEIAVSGDGRFVYTSNRGHDSIAVFAVERDGRELRPAAHVLTDGKKPRHFALDPSGERLLVANQGSDSVVAFRIDPVSGLPEHTGEVTIVGSPVCVLFAS
jgi:6-phosphogluconolactonase